MDFADFQVPLRVATAMNAFARPWCVVGGWAIDLWLGRLTRGHGAARVAVLRDHQGELRDYLCAGKAPGKLAFNLGGRWALLRDRQMLMRPVDLLRFERRDGITFDIELHESDGIDWIDRRDTRVRESLARWIVRAGYNVPVLAPHLVLIDRVRAGRPKDLLDLRVALGQLKPEQLRHVLETMTIVAPEHPWRVDIERVVGV